MLTALAFLCAAVWLPLLMYQISRRGFLVLIVWLAMAPVVSNIAAGRENPFFKPARSYPEFVLYGNVQRGPTYNAITMKEIIREPTRILITIYIIVFLIDILTKRREIIALDRIEIFMSIFVIILFLNIYFQSTRFGYSLRVAYDSFFISFLGYFIMRRLVRNMEQFQSLTKMISYLGGYLIIIGIAERLIRPGLLYRLGGPFDSGTGYFYTLMAVFFVMLSSSIRGRNDSEADRLFPPIVFWFIIGAIPIIITLTWSRGAWVGYLVGLWIFMVMGYRVLRFSRKLMAIGMGLILLPIILLSMYSFIPEDAIENRIADTNSIEWRLRRWDFAISEGMKAPIIGIGLNNLRNVLGEGLGSDNNVHNSFITLLVELGLLGLVAYLAVIASICRLGFQLYRQGAHARDRLRGAAILAMLASYLIPGIFANTLFASTDFSVLYMFAFIGGVAGLSERPGPGLRVAQVPSSWHQRPISMRTSL